LPIEKYKNGTKLSEIYGMYEFDMELQSKESEAWARSVVEEYENS
jgi:hypothetical protein